MKIRFAMASACAVMALCVGFSADAAANRLSTSARGVRTVWTGVRFIAESRTVTCHLTLEQSFHASTISKVTRTLLGHVTRASVSNCTGGSATVLSETLPWHFRYMSFEGTLPLIERIQEDIVGGSFSIQPEGSISCLIRSTESALIGEYIGIVSGVITIAEFIRRYVIPMLGTLCAFSAGMQMEGAGTVTVLNSAQEVTVRLI